MKKILLAIILIGLFNVSPIFGQGCMEPSNDSGPQIIGFVQPQFNYTLGGEDSQGNSLNESSFLFNRARLGVMGNIPYDFEYYVMVEVSAFIYDTPFLLDAFVTYSRLAPYAKFSMGSFKVPISLELNTACHKLHTVYRSEVVRNLAVPFRDLGLLVNGRTDSISIGGWDTYNLLSYSLSVTNGTGVHILDNNMFKTFSGRIVLTPVKYVSIGGSYQYGKHPAAILDADEDKKVRYGMDIEVKVKDFLLQGEYLHGNDVGSYTTGGGCGDPLELHEGSIERDGFWAQAMYMTPIRLQPVVKFEYYDPDKTESVDDDHTNITTFGLNYFPNDWIRLQLNYAYKAEGSASKEIPNDGIFFQVQAVF